MKRGHRHIGGFLYDEDFEKRHFGLEWPTIALIGTAAAAVISAGVSAYGTYESGKAQEQAANYNQKIAQNNAALAQQQADVEAENLKEKNKRLLALELTTQGGMGVETESGSPLLTRADTASQMMRDEHLTK